MSKPRWEHGHRCHGYWLGQNRIAFIGLPPRSPREEAFSYSWSLDWPKYEIDKGDAKSLRAAKQAVEKAYQARLASP